MAIVSGLLFVFLGIAGLRRYNLPLYAASIVYGLLLCVGQCTPGQTILMLAYLDLVNINVCLRFARWRLDKRKWLMLVQQTALALLVAYPDPMTVVFFLVILGYVYFIWRNRRRVYLIKEVMGLAVRGAKCILFSATCFLLAALLPETVFLALLSMGRVAAGYGGYLISLTPLFLQHANRAIIVKHDTYFLGFSLPYLAFDWIEPGWMRV